MPRPKRSKVASTRVDQPAAKLTAGDLDSTRRNPPRHTAAVGNPSANSCDSEGLIVVANPKITKKPRGRKPRGKIPPNPPDTDYTMSGALGEGNVAGAYKELPPGPYTKLYPEKVGGKTVVRKRSTPDRKAKVLVEEAQKKQEQEAAKEKAATETAAKPKKTRRRLSPQVVVEAAGGSADMVAEPSSEINEPPTSAQKPALSPTPSPSPAKGAYPPSALKAQGTPAMETSMMALTNFKRRSRQPSILRMVQPSSEKDESELDLSFMDDFAPDDESTPLHVQKRAADDGTGDERVLRTASSPPSSGLRKRKQGSPTVQVPASSPPAVSSPLAAHARSSPLSSLATPSEHILETQENHQEVYVPEEPDVYSSTMAPPLSSSPPPNNPSGRPVHHYSKRRKTEDFDDLYDVTPLASVASDDDPSPPPKLANTKAKRTTRAPTLSTARLASLLPRRREQPRTRHHEFDIRSSSDLEAQSLDSDADELALPAPRRARGRQGKTNSAPSLAQFSAKNPPSVTKRGRPKKNAKSTAPARTYGRRSSDKENESGNASAWIAGVEEDEQEGETTLETVRGEVSKELKMQAEKFREIDKVDLEFESVDMHGSSSPWR